MCYFIGWCEVLVLLPLLLLLLLVWRMLILITKIHMECTALASFGKKTDDGCDLTLHSYISDLLCLTGLNNAQQEHAQEQPRLTHKDKQRNQRGCA